jgi:HAMP domain-containing protein
VSVSASTAAWIAIGACVAAVLALGAVLYLWTKLRKLREAQRVVLAGGQGDLVDFAVSLQARIDDLHRAVDEVAAGLSRVDRRVDGCVSKTSIVRYDAYEGAGGHQSASLAFLDAARSGVVFSAIQGRDYARIYVKELDHGRAPVALSPEEQEAVERAMSSSA